MKTAVDALGCCPGISVSRIEGQGKQKGATHQFRGREYRVELLPKMRLTIVVKDADAPKVIEAVMGAAKTGEVGDGKIFVSTVDEVYRIRIGVSGEVAV